MKTEKQENDSPKTVDPHVRRILDKLDAQYGTDYRCFLHYETDWQLLFAVILSAQCTDARVNTVTEKLYRQYTCLEDFAGADIGELEKAIFPTGFYHNKAANIKACAAALLEKHGGKVPSDIGELTKLPGVGRKTANVIRGNVFHIPSVVVDTHVKRISRKLGLTGTSDPVKAEYELMEVLPEDHWILWNIDIITLGRTICISGRERCDACFLKEECPSARNKQTETADK